MAVRAQGRGKLAALVGVGFAGEIVGIDAHRARGRGGAVGPGAVEKVLGGGERDLLALEALLDRGDLFGRVEPRVVGDRSTVRQVRLQPAGRPGIGPVDGREVIGVDLGADLAAVTAVDEDAGDVLQHDAEARRAGEAGEPGQALVARRDIFALMRVGAGDHEAVDALALQFRAQEFQARRALFGRRRFGEGLEDGVGQICHGQSARAARDEVQVWR